MDPYIQILYSYIYSKVSNKADVEDILQETITAIWVGLDKFKESSSFKTWIIGITRRKIADFYRKHYSTTAFEVSDLEKIDQLSTSSDSFKEIINEIHVEDCLSTLSDEDRELLFLIFNAQLKYNEIETITGIPVGTIKSRLYYIKRKLRPILEEGSV